MDDLAKRLTAAIEKRSVKVTLNQPHKVTAKKPSGDYYKHAMIGGEEFIPTVSYKGARGDLIFVFKPVAPTKYFRFIEMKQDEAIKFLDGFKKALDDWLGANFEEQYEAAQEEAKQKEEEAHRTAALSLQQIMPEWASW